jgi:galactokinase
VRIDLRELSASAADKFTSAALVRGVADGLRRRGYRVGGFRATVSGRVPKGAGLSSSAAYEVLVASILSHLYNDGAIDPITCAQIAQYAENEHFGKPCGLMDQTTVAVGGLVTIDFGSFEKPRVEQVAFDFRSAGHALVIVETGGNHADLNDDYAALEHEMKAVAAALGHDVLRRTSPSAVLSRLSDIRSQTGDRAVLRALHFFADDQRVVDQVTALRANRFDRFLQLVHESGESSWMLCQNCYSASHVREQGIAIAFELTRSVLGTQGAWRVHGGGFAGTIQAFVPEALLSHYLETMRAVFGPDSCHQTRIRPEGAVRVG